MTNLYLGLIILTLFTLTGYKFSLKYKDRKDFFKDMFTFNELMINEMSFKKTTLLEIHKKSTYKSQFSSILDCYLIDRETILELNILKDDELSFIDNYFSVLGKSDSNSQLKMLETAKTFIKSYAETTNNDALKCTNLCIKLSFLFGLMAFLLII